MPFGMKNSPATFQRLVNTVISGFDRCDAYIDVVIIHNNTFEDHLQSIRNLFDRLSDANWTISLSKNAYNCRRTILCVKSLINSHDQWWTFDNLTYKQFHLFIFVWTFRLILILCYLNWYIYDNDMIHYLNISNWLLCRCLVLVI